MAGSQNIHFQKQKHSTFVIGPFLMFCYELFFLFDPAIRLKDKQQKQQPVLLQFAVICPVTWSNSKTSLAVPRYNRVTKKSISNKNKKSTEYDFWSNDKQTMKCDFNLWQRDDGFSQLNRLNSDHPFGFNLWTRYLTVMEDCGLVL